MKAFFLVLFVALACFVIAVEDHQKVEVYNSMEADAKINEMLGHGYRVKSVTSVETNSSKVIVIYHL